MKTALNQSPVVSDVVTYQEASDMMARAGNVKSLGSVYTRLEVVEFMLDLSGYLVSSRLFEKRLLEPSFGQGDFLLPIVKRLVSSWVTFGNNFTDGIGALKSCILGVELSHQAFESTSALLIDELCALGASTTQANELVSSWLFQGDFLLVDLKGEFDFVVGNPPYVRQDRIPDSLVTEYKKRYQTIYDRADIYIPFIERSLSKLRGTGTHVFICADRWMKNKYGKALREFVSSSYTLKAYIDMSGYPAFHSEVLAYPAITVIAKGRQAEVKVVREPKSNPGYLSQLKDALFEIGESSDGEVIELRGVINGGEPWLIESHDQLQIVRRLEAQLPLLEETGCKVGIGVATGADKVFIGDYDTLDIEESRKLKLAKPKDIETGTINWLGKAVVNPFNDDGKLVELDEYPRLKKYLLINQEIIKNRYVAKAKPSQWYKTIDKITASLLTKPKLLIPDIKGKANVAFDKGEVYPHHNLYFITSTQWDLEALQAVMMSSVGTLFIAAYSTRMKGGYLRFQAQYLRRVRLPYWNCVPADTKQRLIAAARSKNVDECNEVAFDLYGLEEHERAVLGGNGVN